MSLKAFHLFFIAVSVLLCGFVGAWGVQRYQAAGGVGDLTLGAICFVLGAVLIVYGFAVYRKLEALGR